MSLAAQGKIKGNIPLQPPAVHHMGLPRRLGTEYSACFTTLGNCCYRLFTLVVSENQQALGCVTSLGAMLYRSRGRVTLIEEKSSPHCHSEPQHPASVDFGTSMTRAVVVHLFWRASAFKDSLLVAVEDIRV